jgi:cell division septal protein FtsQ
MRKIHRAKPRKKWWKNKFLWEALAILLVFGIAFYTLLLHPALQIHEVRVEGVEKVNARDVQQYISSHLQRAIAFISTRSILLVQPKKIAEGLVRDFPQIATVHVKRILPDTVEAIVKERKAVGIWCENTEDCFFLDNEGIIFERASLEDKNRFLLIRDRRGQAQLSLGESVILQDLLQQIFAIASELRNIQLEAREAIVVSQERITIKTGEGWEIYFAFPSDIPWQITRLKLLLEKEIPAEKRPHLEYIDLRFRKVYFKYQ